ncbi:MAG: hypothetical protein WD490_02440 [Opitutales bacterium]
MKKPDSSRNPTSGSIALRGRGGFALIITISLMAFLVLLLVTLTTLTKVETQLTSNAQKTEAARANARMALNIAIGQLQGHAGPDNRVTARSDIDVQAPSTFWTGVWDASSGTASPLTWLVSGNEGNDPLLRRPDMAPSSPGGDYVRLVGNRTARPNPSYAGVPGVTGAQSDWDVLAPRVPIEVSEYPGRPPGMHTIGHYGYWVGDQGIKASIGITDRSFDVGNYTQEKSAHLRKMASQRFQGETFFPQFNPDDMQTKGNLERVVQYNQLNFTRDGHTRFSDHWGNAGLLTKFHDITHRNYGVLSSTQGGPRLNKVDISVGGGPEAISDYLWSFSMPGAVINSDSSSFPIVSPPAGLPSGEPVFSIAPVISEFALRLGVSDQNGQLAVHYLVQLELWNPYTSTLLGEPLNLQLGSLPTLSVWNRDNPGPLLIDLNDVLPVASFSPANWAPGQVQGFSDSATVSTGIPFARDEEEPDPMIRVAVVEEEHIVLELNRATAPGGQSTQLVQVETAEFDPFFLDPYPRESQDRRMAYLFFYRDGAQSSQWLANMDPRTPVIGPSAFAEAYGYMADPARGATIQFDARPDALLRSTPSSTYVTLFELPRQEPVSLGSLQHMLVPGSRAYHIGNLEGIDNYFLSTMRPNWDGETPLPNSRITLYSDENTPNLGSPTEAADHLLVKGMFNINSTSHEAWASLLSSWIPGRSWGPHRELYNAFFRYSHTAHHSDLIIDPMNVNDPYLQGVRTVDDGGQDAFMAFGASQRDQLASWIVQGIIQHGPFRSLDQFVASGVLQMAIDAVSSINQGIPRDSPAFLSQADILTAIAPFISARSDTFLVRAYGDAQNPVTGRVEARAYCEAIVQRVPAAHSQPQYGRKFEIISFRWLDPEEI